MSEIKPAASYGAPVAAPLHATNNEPYIQRTPGWILACRIVTFVFSIILLGMCGYLMHGKVLEANAFTVVVVIMTWIVVVYTVVTEKVSGANGAYNIWAVLSLDFFMTIMWLASLGANAALRATFRTPVNIESCYNDGSMLDSSTCTISKRADGPAVAGKVGLALMSAVAGVSVIPLLLFLTTLIYHAHTFRLYHQSKKSLAPDNATVEMNAQQTPMLAPHASPVPVPAYTEYPSQTQPQGYPPAQQQQQTYSSPTQQAYASPVQNQGYPQQAFPQQGYPQPTPSPAPVSTPSPVPYGVAQNHPDQGPYQLAGSQPYGDQYQQQHQQQPYIPSPQGTPAPGQPYYPPAQH